MSALHGSSISRAPRRAWSDRLDPVLVKDLRAALRGRFLPAMFLTVVSAASAWTLWRVVWRRDGAQELGPAVFMGVWWLAGFAVGAFLPIWASNSLHEELDGHADGLFLAPRITAARLVLGKFLAALVFAFLVACGTLPFAVFAQYLGAVSIVDVAVFAHEIVLQAAYWTALGLAVASSFRVRWARALGVVALLAWLCWEHRFVADVLRYGLATGSLGSQFEWFTVTTGAVATALIVGLLLAFASGRLMHPEESRSTALRQWALAIALCGAAAAVAGAWAGAPLHWIRYVVERAWVLSGFVVFLVATEPDALPRTFRARPSASLARRCFDALTVSGGGRGALLAFVLIAIAVLSARGLGALTTAAGEAWYERTEILVSLPCVFVLLPAAAFAQRNVDARATLRLRLAIAAVWIGSGIACTVANRWAGGTRDPMELLLDPFGLASEGRGPVGLLADLKSGLWLLFLIAALVLNLPRMLHGARAVGALRSPSTPSHAAPQP